jgi:hypothetical protein
MIRAIWMEKIMSKTNDTPNFSHGTLADSELDTVTGGRDDCAFRGRYQLRLEEANGLLSAQSQKD